MAEAPRVLLAASEDWDAPPRLARTLAAAGARVTALAPARGGLARSRFVAERRLLAPGATPDAALERLLEELPRGPWAWVGFGDDPLLDRAVERADDPRLAAVLPARAPGAARAAVSKSAFAERMRAAGVRMPPGRGGVAARDLPAAVAELGWPAMIKPDRGFAGEGMFAVAGATELAARASGASGPFRVERRVDGIVGGTAALFDRGRPAWWSSFRKSGVWPKPFGPSCRRAALQLDGIEPILRALGADLDLHGPCGVDWILDPDGAVWVIELNGRPITVAETDAHSTTGLVDAWRDLLAGRDATRPPPPGEGVEWHMLPASYELACAEGDRAHAARLLCGLAGPTNAPWKDLGLMPAHARKLARAAARGFFGGGARKKTREKCTE